MYALHRAYKRSGITTFDPNGRVSVTLDSGTNLRRFGPSPSSCIPPRPSAAAPVDDIILPTQEFRPSPTHSGGSLE